MGARPTPLPANDAKAVELRATQLRRRRERLEADLETVRKATASFVLEYRPHYTRAQLGRILGISEPRVAQLLAEPRETNGADLATV